MRVNRFYKLFYVLALFSLLFVQALSARADFSFDEAAAVLPDSIGDFRALGAPREVPMGGIFETQSAGQFDVTAQAMRAYSSARGQRFSIEVIKTRSDSGAYSLLLNQRQKFQSEVVKVADIGTIAFEIQNGVLFFKGPAFVSVYSSDKTPQSKDGTLALARLFADTLDKGENEIPVLVKHLPEWETAQDRALYAVSLTTLQEAAGRRPILDAVSFEGGAEAVTATYGQSRLVIVENTTPQLATTNDARINAKLKELRDGGQPVPTAYRRVGNYSVFVFDAPDEATATKLIDSIKYEQVVQWLGRNPHDYQRAMRQYTNTTAGVILAVLKASGLSLLLCLGIGAIFGAVVFKRRRQQQTATEAFSDAGGMLRLNLDEITQTYDASKMLGPGERQ